ncbi:AraC family transcriptional regulator [Reyranella sp.]|uniref:AraC family transcriptional regulator n=1 Tax=Reyranella sp. TaxID=1929291 RepID=UPI00272F277C|nr:AraC family transcriptional regulator [Reyranella sp.]MDP2375885.1 AraC family transcriptional regulator [Reyranella sp.]
MIETPSFLADSPARAPAPPDADMLSEMLRVVRLTGAVFLSARLTAPFGLVSPKRFDGRMPMAHLRHISVFHLVAEGECVIETASGARHQLVAGDLLLLPFADQHRLSMGTAPDMVFDPSVVHRGPTEGVWTVRHGGGGAETRLVCGFIESAEVLVAPMFRLLPELLVEHAGDETVGAQLASTVRDMLTLVEAATPGTQAILGRMMELLFVEVLRRHASRMPAGSKGLLAALNDPIVGRALQLVHADPARRWTADEIARESGSSRTVLGERFNTLLGRPPIDYLVGWRMQLAADRLRHGKDGIARIAIDVGYESEAAFSRAFKRVTGVTPGRWREGAGDSPDLMPLQFNKPVITGPAGI